MPVLAIVGGGVSGTSLFHQLVSKISSLKDEKVKNCEIYLFEKDTDFGPGLAWGKGNSDVQLFNLAAGTATVKFGEWDSFLRWCKENEVEDIDATSYPPRHRFQEYLKSVVKSSMDQAENVGIQVFLKTSCAVTSISKTNVRNQFSVVFDGGSLIADVVFLCVGSASRESQNFLHLRGKPNYLSSPWPFRVLEKIPKSSSVAVLGTGLTAVDTVKQLSAQGHSGPMYMVSRRGLLPTIKGGRPMPWYSPLIANIPGVLQIIEEKGKFSNGLLEEFVGLIRSDWVQYFSQQTVSNPENLEDIKQAQSIALSCFNTSIADGTRDGLKELSQQLKEFEESLQKDSQLNGQIVWQSHMLGILVSGVIPFMWSSLHTEEKKMFNSRYRTVFQVYSNSMPACSGYEVKGLVERGLLEVHGGLVAVKQKKDLEGFLLHFRDETVREVTYVVNSTGLGVSLALENISEGVEKKEEEEVVLPLLSDMLGNGTVCAHPFGGVCVDPQTCRVLSRSDLSLQQEKQDVSSNDLPLLYAVGHLLAGEKLVTSGIVYCCLHAAAAVNDAVQQLVMRVQGS